jgi:predicted negative regulator of RcsB-dependent stress response
VDRLTRHELKTDKFVEEVGHTVTFLEQHRPQLIRYGGIALALLVVAAGVWYFMKSRAETRAAELARAIQVINARIGPQQGEGADPTALTFPTAAERELAVKKALNDIISRYGGSAEAGAAHYLLGLAAADKGNLAEAEKELKIAISEAGADYASLAKLALAEIQAGMGKTADAEKALRELIARPTLYVTKEQASLALARILAKSRPQEARKLVEPFMTATGPVGRVAMNLMSELGPAK